MDRGEPSRSLRRRRADLRSVRGGAWRRSVRRHDPRRENGRRGRERVGDSAGGPRERRPRRRIGRGRRTARVRGRRGSGGQRVGRFGRGPRALRARTCARRPRDLGRSSRPESRPRTARSRGIRPLRGASPLRTGGAHLRRPNRGRPRQPATRGRPRARRRGVAPRRTRPGTGAVRRRGGSSMACDRDLRGTPRRRGRGRRQRRGVPPQPKRIEAVRHVGEPPRDSSGHSFRSAPAISAASASSSRSSRRLGTGRNTPRSRARGPNRPSRPNGSGTYRVRGPLRRVGERARRRR